MNRRVAMLVVASLVASLGVLTASEAVVSPPPVAALPPSGLTTLSGSGGVGHGDGPATTATFDTLLDAAVSPDGAFLYVLDHGSGGGRQRSIRKVDTATGEVTPFSTGGPLNKDARRIEVSPQGDVWVSINNGSGIRPWTW